MGEILALLEVLGPIVSRSIDAYQKARALAAQLGVTEADLADADARFLRVYFQAPETIPAPPLVPVNDPTTVHYIVKEDAIAVAEKIPGRGVIERADGLFQVWPLSVGPVPGVQVWPVN